MGLAGSTKHLNKFNKETINKIASISISNYLIIITILTFIEIYNIIFLNH